MQNYTVQIYPCLTPAGTFTWVITWQGSVVDFGNQATFNLALKQAGAKLKQYADALP